MILKLNFLSTFFTGLLRRYAPRNESFKVINLFKSLRDDFNRRGNP